MDAQSPINPGLIRLGGVAGLLVGVIILTFAIIGDLHGIVFF